MSATLKQTLANRLNALRSTGPKSAEGKARASQNSRTHGLSRAVGAAPPLEWADLVEARKSSWRSSYRPNDAAQDYLFDRLVVESVRLDQCEARIAAARIEFADRAGETWDDDRRAEVAQLAAKLHADPARIHPLLLQSRHGVEWLLDAWEEVAESLRFHEQWTGPNWLRAMDLIGLSLDAREPSSPFDIDPDDISAGPGLAFIREVMGALRSRLTGFLIERDDRTRLDAEQGLELTDPKPIRLLERYAADARRRVRWSMTELRKLQASSPVEHVAPSAASPPLSSAPAARPDRRKLKSTNTLTPSPAPAHNEPIATASPTRNEPAARETPARNEPSPVESSPSNRPRTPLLPTSTAPVLPNRRARRAQAAASRRRS